MAFWVIIVGKSLLETKDLLAHWTGQGLVFSGNMDLLQCVWVLLMMAVNCFRSKVISSVSSSKFQWIL